MDGLLTPVATLHTNEKVKGTGLQVLQESSSRHQHESETKPKPKSHKHPPNSPEDALETLRNEPDYESLISTLRFLAHGPPQDPALFGIKMPGPLSAQLVQVLVSEIVPNYWTLLQQDFNGSRGSGTELLLACLRSITGINAILVRLRALTQEAKSEVGSKAKRPDLSVNLGILLSLLCHVLQGDNRVREIWQATTSGLDPRARARPLSQELLSIFGGGRIVGLTAEATTFVDTAKVQGSGDDDVWPADAVKYTKWLGQNIVAWQQSGPSQDESKFCSDLFAKALRLGHFVDVLVKYVLSNLLLTKGVNHGRFGLLLADLPQMEQRKVMSSVLKVFSNSYANRLGRCESDNSAAVISAVTGALSSIVAPDSNGRSHLVEWLTSSSGAGLGEGIAIRRAVLAVISQDKDSIVDVLEKSINQFGDQLYIKHSPILQQEAHVQVLLLSAGYVHRKSPIKLAIMVRSGVWLNAISNRLATSHQRARFLGMVVGEAISGLVDKGDKRLDFHVEETGQAEGKWYKELVNISDQIGNMDPLLVTQETSVVPKKSIQKKPTTKTTTTATPRAAAKPPQQGFIIEELGDEEMDEDVVAYAKPDSDAEDSDDDATLVRRDKPKAPVYIRNLISYFRDTESYDHQKLALMTAPTLIRRKANFGTEVAEHAEELASLLVGLQDKFEIDNFDGLRVQGMMALVVARPELMGQWFSKTFFDGDYSISQRASILAVLGLGARELAGFEASEYTAAVSFPSKTLPERVERLFISGGPSNSYTSPSSSSTLKPLPANAVEKVAKSLISQFLAPMAATAADAATGPDVLKLSTFTSQLENSSDKNPKIKIKSRTRPRVRAIPNTTAQLISTSFFSPLAARFQAALHAPSSRTRGIVFHPYLLALYLKTLALLLHAAGPSTLALPQMTAELWRLLLSTSVRAHAVGDLALTHAVLFGLLALLDVNENRMRDVCQELGSEVVETQEWVAGVFTGVRGGDAGDGAGEEEQVKMLAAGVLVRLRGGLTGTSCS
ncbi:telomere length regulation protein-domain-containing protein [Lasiosphaeria miniovina]|uniref:Telomere length regulation protein-domain-containing protein n=1 Tax=Lasiosphaeria miniovina TaxID=1954250 RepID=A0AA40ED54_9PEZI|nr:telomere length regulation protein-domain-containing protein [Lasiosphaeria miniovina]KAK0733972.1 telomere length regulation protein-domain-containing protein [Lasiosphaeria miniovina]